MNENTNLIAARGCIASAYTSIVPLFQRAETEFAGFEEKVRNIAKENGLLPFEGAGHSLGRAIARHAKKPSTTLSSLASDIAKDSYTKSVLAVAQKEACRLICHNSVFDVIDINDVKSGFVPSYVAQNKEVKVQVTQAAQQMNLIKKACKLAMDIAP